MATGTLILAWTSLAPLACVSISLVRQGRAEAAALLLGTGFPVFIWNWFQLRRLLSSLFQDNAPRKWACGATVGILPLSGIQAGSAILCNHFAGAGIPVNVLQWLWVPVYAFGGLILANRTHLVILQATVLLVSTVCLHWINASQHLWHWMAGQTALGGFTMACCAAVTWAARGRQAAAHLAADMSAANGRLELQADHASLLAAAQARHRLADEIQDSVGHSLTIAGAQLELAKKLLPASSDTALEAVQKAQWAVHDGQTELRRSVSTSHIIPGRKKQSLTESLSTLVCAEEDSGLTLSVGQTGVHRMLPALVEISLYRCAQEGITNARRHSQATEISVNLDFSSSSVVSLSVRDNGHEFRDSFEEDARLKRLEERALLLHGQFRTGSTPNGGGFCQMAIPG